MSYTRNTDPTYYYKNSGAVNCGSFALRLNEWYEPEEDYDEIYDWIIGMSWDYDDYEISNLYADIIIDRILSDFSDEIEICDGRAPSTSDTELIAFATFCEYDESEEYCNWDFHFKVFRNGIWQQKCGCFPPEFCELDEWGRYTSKVTYFYHKIGDTNESQCIHKRK